MKTNDSKLLEKVLSKLEAIVHISLKEMRYGMFRAWKNDKRLNLDAIVNEARASGKEEGAKEERAKLKQSLKDKILVLDKAPINKKVVLIELLDFMETNLKDD